MYKYIIDPNRTWNEENGYIKVSCKNFIGCKLHKGEGGGCPVTHKCVDTISWTEFITKVETLREYKYDY